MFLYYFFFFKQKTAYEMRISDWSSDVCSSDLGNGASILDDMVVGDNQTARGIDHEPGARRDPRRQCLVGHAEEEAIIRIAQQQIGRASCRERVCQYV